MFLPLADLISSRRGGGIKWYTYTLYIPPRKSENRLQTITNEFEARRVKLWIKSAWFAVIMTSELEIVRSELFQLNLITKFISIAPALMISHLLCFQVSEISSNYTQKIEKSRRNIRNEIGFFFYFLGWNNLISNCLSHMLYNCLNSILLINAERERERTNINLIFNGRNPQVRFREIFHDDFCFNFSFFGMFCLWI